MGGFDNILSILLMVTGAYVLICGLSRKGGIYKNDYPEEVKDRITKNTSIFAIYIGLVVTATGILDFYTDKFPAFRVYTLIGMGLTVVSVVIYAIVFRKKFGSYLR
ncbi:MAG: hypothetical protein ACOX3W_04570 [Christensenellaceae bacterium]|jgi:hypothetical protein